MLVWLGASIFSSLPREKTKRRLVLLVYVRYETMTASMSSAAW